MADTPNEAPAQQEPSEPKRKVYRIALTMSGAISAGAYTAGVFDFLMQALTELELAKNRPEDRANLPDHDIRIVAFAGASAGGITSALGTVALGYGMTFEPANTLHLHRVKDDKKTPIDCVLPRLYDTWVVRPRMFGPKETDAALLSVDDLNDGIVNSLLNWRVLNEIRDAALARPDNLGEGAPYAFFAEPLHVYLTISNLRGVPYEVKGDNDAAAYHMLSHGDRLHFAISGIGRDKSVASGWADQDQQIAMSVDDLRSAATLPPRWQLLGDAALATAAFPGGLSARLLKATRADFDKRSFPAPEFEGAGIKTKFPAGFAEPPLPAEFGFVNVDGGMINNDPFEYAHYTLLDDWRNAHAKNPRDEAAADRSVIMISPFPEGATFNTEDSLDIGLLAVAKVLLPTLISQARFKLTELAAAADSKTASRWLIAPRRTDDITEVPSSANIACGLLGGFGGFLDQSFREHDFQLGRRNCQKFLMELKSSAFTTSTGARVIPLLGSAALEVPQLDWPRMSRDNFEILMKRIELRANKVVPALIKQEATWWAIRWGIKAAWQVGGLSKLMSVVRGSVLSDLILRDQIADGLSPSFSADERKVIAAMADPRYDLRTVSGIQASTKLDPGLIESVVKKAMDLPTNAIYCVWQSTIRASHDRPTFTLHSRKLTARALPLIGSVLRAVYDVTID